jgi:hypothetical protein
MKPRERRLLRFVQAYKAVHGNELPTLAEVAAGLGLRNEAKVRRLVETLIVRGRLAEDAVIDDGAGGGGLGGGGGGQQN